MKKIFLSIIFLCLIFINQGLAQSYYFKKCQLTELLVADYLIDLEKNEIRVILNASDGAYQEWTDKIGLVEKDQIVSEKIKSTKDKSFYFIYYLNANSKSVIKQNFRKQSGIKLITPIGPKKESYCADVKADWEKQRLEAKLEREKEKKLQEKIKAEEDRKKFEEKSEKALKEKKKNKNKHRIKFAAKKWVRLSKYDSTFIKKIENSFDKKAKEICASNSNGNFDILERKVEVLEYDETPAWGTEEKILVGIDGLVECK